MLEIRPVSPSDYALWLPLWKGYNAFYGRVGAAELPGDVTTATWDRLLDPVEPMYAYVAECDGALLGFAHVILHRSTIQLAPNCYMQDLFVSQDARGRGVARALIEAIRICEGRRAATCLLADAGVQR